MSDRIVALGKMRDRISKEGFRPDRHLDKQLAVLFEVPIPVWHPFHQYAAKEGYESAFKVYEPWLMGWIERYTENIHAVVKLGFHLDDDFGYACGYTSKTSSYWGLVFMNNYNYSFSGASSIEQAVLVSLLTGMIARLSGQQSHVSDVAEGAASNLINYGK